MLLNVELRLQISDRSRDQTEWTSGHFSLGPARGFICEEKGSFRNRNVKPDLFNTWMAPFKPDTQD